MADFCRLVLEHGYVMSSWQDHIEKQKMKRNLNPYVLIPSQLPAK